MKIIQSPVADIVLVLLVMYPKISKEIIIIINNKIKDYNSKAQKAAGGTQHDTLVNR